jgi:CHAD domain-containing protein
MKTSHPNSSKSHAGQLLLEALEKNWREYLVEVERCKVEFSNEAVHDLRIAIQKAMGIVQLLNSMFPRTRLQKINQAFEAQLDDLDSLRDTQVILAEISETIQELPGLHNFQKHQRMVEKKKLRALRIKIKKSDQTGLSKRIRKERHFFETKFKHDPETQLMQALDDAFLVVKQRLDWVNPVRPATIRRAGAAFKTFLLKVEVIQPVFMEYPTAQLEQMNRYQSLINEIQDLEILLQMLADFSEYEGFSDFGPVRHYYDSRYDEAIAAYAKEMGQLYFFWRLSPALPFPWNKTG